MFGNQNCFTNSFQSIQNSITAVSNRLSTVASSLISSTNLPIYLQNYTFSTSGASFSPYFSIVGGSSHQSITPSYLESGDGRDDFYRSLPDYFYL